MKFAISSGSCQTRCGPAIRTFHCRDRTDKRRRKKPALLEAQIGLGPTLFTPLRQRLQVGCAAIARQLATIARIHAIAEEYGGRVLQRLAPGVWCYWTCRGEVQR